MTPPCGFTHLGYMLFLILGGTRKLVPLALDISDAISISFCLQIGCSDSQCNPVENGELVFGQQ